MLKLRLCGQRSNLQKLHLPFPTLESERRYGGPKGQSDSKQLLHRVSLATTVLISYFPMKRWQQTALY